jgi:hypothetical protein
MRKRWPSAIASHRKSIQRCSESRWRPRYEEAVIVFFPRKTERFDLIEAKHDGRRRGEPCHRSDNLSGLGFCPIVFKAIGWKLRKIEEITPALRKAVAL